MITYGFAGVIIKQEEKYLLIQEAKEEARGLWNVPAGRPMDGESIDQTAIREIKEETGYDIELIRDLGEWPSTIHVGVYRKLFLGKIIGGVLETVTEDTIDAQWFTKEEIYSMKDQLRDEWVVKGIEILENIKKDN
jgi:8-oxo-dGTP diphosphatase